MITQTINLNLIPGAVPPRVNVTQYDEGSRTIVANLYNGTSTFAPSAGTTAKVKGTKPDKHGFEYDATISGRTVEIDLTQQMSCVAGDVPCEVELTLGDEVLGTGTFVLRVKASALADDTDISETELPDIIDAARSSAASAAASAEQAQEAANSVSVEYTVSGNPISVSAFPTEATTSMTISPTQNLHGYDKPWAGGAGKNKLDVSDCIGTQGGKTFALSADLGITVSGSASSTVYRPTNTNVELTPSTSYVINGMSADIKLRFQLYDSNNTMTRELYATNVDLSFTTAADEVKAVAYIIVSNNANGTIHPMLRLATESDATFAPYTNICPITGITTATVQTTDGETTNTASMALGEMIYGGSVNFNAGTGSKTMANIASYAGETINEPWVSSMDEYTEGGTPTTGAQVVYTLSSPTALSLTPDTLTLLDGVQTVSGNGETVTISYNGNVKQYIDTKVPDAPTTDGTYTLTCVVSGGVPTYSWT